MGVLRIVKMEFEEELVCEFDALFSEIQSDIEAMPGCERVMMMKSSGAPNTRTTLSWWAHEDDLNNYRKSALFGEVWPQTKAKFAEKPLAWSVDWKSASGLPFGV